MGRKSNDQTIREAVDELLKTYKLDEKMLQVKLVNSWEKVMGAVVAKRTTEIKIIGRKLYVSLNSAALRQELFQARQRIAEMLNEEVGAVVVEEVVLS